jgi:hypothetical protein
LHYHGGEHFQEYRWKDLAIAIILVVLAISGISGIVMVSLYYTSIGLIIGGVIFVVIDTGGFFLYYLQKFHPDFRAENLVPGIQKPSTYDFSEPKNH